MSAGLAMYYGVGIAATGIAAVLAFIVALRRGWSVPRGVLIGMVIVVPPILLTQQLLKHASLHMYADFSHWLQLLHAIATTGKPFVFSHELLAPGTLNYLSVHFVPLIYLFALPFKLFPYPQALIVLNVAIMSSAAILLYLIARHRTGDQRFALFTAALLLWYPTFQYTTLYEFEMLRFSIPVLFWMLYAWERQRIGWYYVLVILATLVREEVGLTVGMFGAYLFLCERRRLHGSATCMIGFGSFLLITQWVMPLLRVGEFTHIAAAGSFAQFGSTPVSIAFGILEHPVTALWEIMRPIKLANVGMLAIPLLGIPLLAPATLLSMVPTVAIGLLSDSTVHSSYLLYYVSPAVPFLFFAFVRAWPRVLGFASRLATSGMSVGDRDTAKPLVLCVVVGLFVGHVFFGGSPFATQFWSERFRPAPFRTQAFHWSVYRVTDHHRSVDRLIASIPDAAIVTAQQFLFPRLTHVRATMDFSSTNSRDGAYRSTYLLYDRTNNSLHPDSPAFVSDAEFRDTILDGDWERITADDGYELYARR